MTANPERAREAARAILRAFGVKGVPVPVERIIKARNIVLQYAPLEEDLSGMAYIKDGVGIIGVNALHHPNRQRFSAAHELGHHELHVQEIGKAVHVDKGFRVLLRDDVSSQGIDPLEIEANAFASELLMPSEFLLSALDAGGLDIEDDAGIEALARKFRVSAAAMRYRLAGRF
ncbi:MAG: ImmA/IrrE family metallo-endopeptidase [Bradyrhizobium sp.]|nr:ImmA/IrrE family metallo-endopeptidase [Bradyrhizobium sp.]